MSEALRKAAEQALKAWEQGLGHLARDTLKTALSETEQPPRLTDDEIIEIANLGWWKSESDITSDGLDIARAIETTVRKQFGVQE